MSYASIQHVLLIIQHAISITGVLIILSGIFSALLQYLYIFLSGQLLHKNVQVNVIRLHLGRIFLLGLEFIVAADLIGTTTAPDYYSVGILAIIVVIRTLLSFTINREITTLSKEK